MRIHPTAARGFEAAAEVYERGRPGYPEEAVAWLAEQLGLGHGRTVLDLAAGTGKLTRQLLPTGARVIAVEPIAAMRRELQRVLTGVETLAGTAEKIPLPAGSVDAVTVAQAFHWFDPERAVPELRRVLRPGGALALLWNTRDLDDPLQAKIDELLEPFKVDTEHTERDPRQDFGSLFTPLKELLFRQEQWVTRKGLLDTIGSRSYIAALSERERAALLARLNELTESMPEPFALPYVTEVFLCFRQTERA